MEKEKPGPSGLEKGAVCTLMTKHLENENKILERKAGK